MSDERVEARWDGGHRFEVAGSSSVPVTVDGNKGAGPSPMESLLISLATCMGADVVEILDKSRVAFEGLAVRVEADRRPDPPRRYTAIRLTYEVSGLDAGAEEKLQRAVDLSRDTYCSVLHTLRPEVEVSIEVETD